MVRHAIHQSAKESAGCSAVQCEGCSALTGQGAAAAGRTFGAAGWGQPAGVPLAGVTDMVLRGMKAAVAGKGMQAAAEVAVLVAAG